LRKGGAGETYEAIGRGPFNLESLPVLADAQGPFGSPTSDSERSMITLDAEEVLMVLYAFGNGPGLMRALDFAVDCLTSYCNAREVETALITAHGSA
jgi:DNA/RNA-binding domain of Phe-tRNA-synthetase-like protein